MTKPKLIGIAPQLIVPDLVQTAEYYRDILGFEIIGYFLDPPVYAMVKRDEFQIHFGKADADFEINKNGFYKKGCTDLIIWIPEIDAFYEELRSRNAIIFQEITKRVYGSREFIIQDCNGYLITVGD